MIDQHQRRALIEAVRRVGQEIVRPRFRRLDADEVRTKGSPDDKASPDDLVTIVDTESEAALGRACADILPGATIIGEEAVAADPRILDGAGDAETCVLIDPLDGTANFASGLAVHGMILAVLERGETVFGLLHDPVLDDWVWAVRGGGAWFGCEGTEPRRLHASPRAGAPGFMTLELVPGEARERVARAVMHLGSLRSLRCSCQEYRTLATGHARYCVGMGGWPWDHAAGVLAIEEAGGCAGLLDGRAYDPARRSGPLAAASDADTLERLRAALGFLGD